MTKCKLRSRYCNPSTIPLPPNPSCNASPFSKRPTASSHPTLTYQEEIQGQIEKISMLLREQEQHGEGSGKNFDLEVYSRRPTPSSYAHPQHTLTPVPEGRRKRVGQIIHRRPPQVKYQLSRIQQLLEETKERKQTGGSAQSSPSSSHTRGHR